MNRKKDNEEVGNLPQSSSSKRALALKKEIEDYDKFFKIGLNKDMSNYKQWADKYYYINRSLLEAELKGIEETEKEFADWLDAIKSQLLPVTKSIVEHKIAELRGEK